MQPFSYAAGTGRPCQLTGGAELDQNKTTIKKRGRLPVYFLRDNNFTALNFESMPVAYSIVPKYFLKMLVVIGYIWS
jgi:hypothetical protein